MAQPRPHFRLSPRPLLVCCSLVLYTIPHRLGTMSERDTLLPKEDHVPKTTFFSPIRRVLFVALVSAASFAFTQTSLIYAFRVMTCDDYYDHSPHYRSPESHDAIGHGVGDGIMSGGKDRCSIPVIEGRTARAIAIMSTMTTFCCTSPCSPNPAIRTHVNHYHTHRIRINGARADY
jgi:hypothetical protein